MPKKIILLSMARRIAWAFLKNVYIFAILLLRDLFDLIQRWRGVNYQLPSWLFWVLLVIAIGLATWRTIEDTKKSLDNEDRLDAIKSDLIAIDKYEKDAAVAQGKAPYSNSQIASIENDFNSLYTISAFEAVIQQVISGNVEPLFEFFRAIGDILDASGCGLKLQLQSISQYGDTSASLTGKLVTLRIRTKKRELIRSNVIRLQKAGYGLNSGMVLRGMLKRARPRTKNEQAVARSVVVGLEALENMGREFLTYGLSHLDSQWKLRYNPEQLMPSRTEVILGRVSTLSKKRFGKLHDFKEMVKRNLP